ncbi:MAG: hypothetical protein ABSF22_04050 [Bryobacteraceae bacterium]|jgi:hypothetical protein
MRPFLTYLPISFLLAASAHGTVIYSDITNFSGFGFQNGGATTVNGALVTDTVADDISVIPAGVGAAVTGLTFSVANLGTASVTAQVILTFWDANGASGGPGTELGALEFNAIAFPSGEVGTFSYDPGTTIFTAPSEFWVGETFTSTTDTAGQLNDLGLGLFAPPTVGTSTDSFFAGTTPGQFNTSNPAGTLSNFGGNPVADFGFAFSDTDTPEPASALLVAAGIALAALFAKRLAPGR